jgi:lysophospholipase L1-like esterase
VRQIIFQIIFPVPDQAAPLKDFEHILKLSNELAKENNSKLYFVYLSAYPRYKWNNNNDNFRNYKKVTEIVENLSIPIIDLNKELLEKHKDRLSLFPFRMVGHYNEKGNQLIAKTIFRKINELEK